MNSSKVLSARLSVLAAGGAAGDDAAAYDDSHEMLLLSPADDAADPNELMSHPAHGQTWRCMLRSDAVRVEDRLELSDGGGHHNRNDRGAAVCARVVAVHRPWLEDGEADGIEADVMFEVDNQAAYNMDSLLRAYGAIPIPPYLNRDAVFSDTTAYQTVYADKQGSVAAPTAGLHFSDDMMDELRADGSAHTVSDVTLHVGAGTFKPVVGGIDDHEMHRESFDIGVDVLDALIASLSKNVPIVPVGTTSVRVLESLYWMGARKLLRGGGGVDDVDDDSLSPPPPVHLAQWEPREIAKEYSAACRALPNADCALVSLSSPSMNGGNCGSGSSSSGKKTTMTTSCLRGTTEICIAQGYEFQIIDGLVTNFHQSKSTLMHLTAAVVGGEERLRECYAHAIREEYRFLSFGDACFMVLA
jgi:S-adenosylmethionine:tRNA-ribosyltransferase-isomerase (queuine synthetase)